LAFQGIGIEFSHISDRLFTGFTVGDGFCIATPEKALLDTIYLRKGLLLRDELELDQLDSTRLLQMAQVFPLRVQKEVERLVR